MENVFRVKQIELGYSAVLRSAMDAGDQDFVREELSRNYEFVATKMGPDMRTLYQNARLWIETLDGA